MVMSAATNVLIVDFVPVADCSERIGTSHDNGCTPSKLVCVNNIRNYFLEESDHTPINVDIDGAGGVCVMIATIFPVTGYILVLGFYCI